MNVIELSGVNYLYGRGTPFEKMALRDVELAIEQNTVTGIIGHTGSGKSTLVQLFNGLLKPLSGTVKVAGKDIWADGAHMRELRFRVGLVFQYPEYQLFEESVRRDIAFGPSNMGLSESEINERVRRAAGFAGIPEELLEKSPFELSGGQKRRAAIAGVMAMQPEVLVLDEPAAGLDPAGRAEILGGVAEYRRATGSTVVIVSHSMEDIARYCDRILVVSDGSVIRCGTREEIFSDPAMLASIGLDVPQITRFISLLRERGIELPTGIYTVSQAREALLALFGKRGGNDA